MLLSEVRSSGSGQPFIRDRLEVAGGLQIRHHFIDAMDQRVSLLEEQAELLAIRRRSELADDLALEYPHCSDVVGGGQVDDESVDLPVLHRALRIIGVIEDLRLIVRLDDLVDEGSTGRADLSIYSPEDLLRVENELNNRLRITLIDKTPAELFEPLLAFHNHPLLQ